MTTGIHHITAIASDAVKNVEFYSQHLGLRLVKKTVNQDDVETYHLFFGDKLGHPGMDLTFFIFRPPMQGKNGNGLVTKISLAVPEDSLPFWKKRFETLKIKQKEIITQFGKKRIVFFDSDGQQLELVGISPADLDNASDIWTTKEVTKEQAIRNFYSTTLSVTSQTMISSILLYVFGYTFIEKEDNTFLYEIKNSNRASHLEIKEDPSASQGFNAAGTVHHIAFRAKDEKEQLVMRDKVLELGLYPTEVINRFYFKSVYFRTPAGILFEIATDGPGFTADEKESELGKKLALPPFLENQRKDIELNLPSLNI